MKNIKEETKKFLERINKFPFHLLNYNLIYWLEAKEETKEKLKKEYFLREKERFIKDNLDYFHSGKYQEEVNELKKCIINAKKGKFTPNCKYNKLLKVYSIINSNLSKFEKDYQVRKQIDSVDELFDLIYPFVVTSCNNSIIKSSIEAYNQLLLDVMPNMSDEIVIKETLKIYDLHNKDKNSQELKKLKEQYLTKYKIYFSNIGYKTKYRFFMNHKNNIKKYKSYEKLEKVIEIYNSKLNDYEKIYKITKIIGLSPKDIYDIIAPFTVTLIDEPLIKESMKVYLYLEKNKNQIATIVDTVKNYEKYAPFYEYSKYIIESYINDPFSYQTSTFYRKFNVDGEIFNYCLNVIITLDDKLYNKYLEKKKQNSKKRIKSVHTSMEDIVFGIKTGYFKDGTLVTTEEFLRRVPFKFHSECVEVYPDLREINGENNHALMFYRSFEKRLSLYTKFILKEDDQLIKNYMRLNGINQQSIGIVDRVLQVKDRNEIVINYMQKNGYPMIYGIYMIMLDKFNKGEITEEDAKDYQNKKQKPILTI